MDKRARCRQHTTPSPFTDTARPLLQHGAASCFEPVKGTLLMPAGQCNGTQHPTDGLGGDIGMLSLLSASVNVCLQLSMKTHQGEADMQGSF